MAQLIIYTSPRGGVNQITPSEKGQLSYVKKRISSLKNRKGPLTPRIKDNSTRKVINLLYCDPKTNFTQLAQDFCHDSGDKYYGHEIK